MKNLFLKYTGVVLFGALAVTSCNDKDVIPMVEPATCVESIEISLPENLQKYIYVDETGSEVLPLLKGEKAQLKYTLCPEDVTYSEVIWSTSQPNNASVEDGLVTALSGGGLGYSIVSVTPMGMHENSGVSSSLKVKVSNELKNATSINITSDATDVYEGETLQLTANILPQDATYQTVDWTSSDNSIASVDMHGVVTGVKVATGTEAKVTVTATALDANKATASVEITVKRTVNPESVTIDQTYAAPGYLCSIGEKKVTLQYTTIPADCTLSQIKWESSDTSIASVVDGVVYFNNGGNFGDFTITATCPNGNKSEIKMSMPAGLIREVFDNPDNLQFQCNPTSGGVTTWIRNGLVECTTYRQNDTNQRGDFKAMNKIYLCPANYPIVAWKMEDVKESVPGCTYRAFKFDTQMGEVGNQGAGDGYQHKYKCADGSNVFIYNFAEQGVGASQALIDQTNVTEFTTFQIKYADMRTFSSSIKYKAYWVQSFKNIDELKAYLQKTGVEYEVVK